MGYFEDTVKGLYDFTSDTLDNIGNGLSEVIWLETFNLSAT